MKNILRLSVQQIAQLTGLVLVTLLVLLQLAKLGNEAELLMKRLDGMLYDIRLRATLEYRPVYNETPIAIIDIDEKSLAEYGRWPWSRRIVGDLVDKLANAGVVVIAFDILFAEPEEHPLDELVSEVGLPLVTNSGLMEYYQAIDGDQKLSESLQNVDTVLGVLFEQQRGISKGQLPDEVVLFTNEVPIKRVKAQPFNSFIGNIDKLKSSAMSQGFFNAVPDIDGSIRRAALLVQHQGVVYPSLALEAARLYSLADNIVVETAQDGPYHNILGLKINDQQVLTDKHGRVLVPYRGERDSFPYISAADVLSSRVGEERLADSIVFIGTSSVGLADLRETPVGIQYPGVEVHANVLEGILHPEVFSYRHDLADWFTVIYLTFFGLLMALFFPRLGPINMAVWGGTLLVITIGFNSFLWINEKSSLPLTTPILLCVLITMLNIAFGFLAESSQKKVIKGMFDQYVPPAHIDKMLSDPNSVSLKGDRKNMSVLFSDIRSFTTISEGLSANELKELLNRYFSPITKTILDHQGTIDKYVGDMVMAFWGAPLDDHRHAFNAIQAAFSMLAITAQLRDEFYEDGWPAIHVGIGINTGDMNVGDMGSEFRRAYTVLGDAVNLGSRLESLTKFYGVELLVSEYTREQALDDFEFRLIDKVRVKGKNTAVAAYQPICAKGQLNQQDSAELMQYDEAYQLYLAQDWLAAEQAFSDLIALNPRRKLYSIYAERITELKQYEKQASWDGSYTHQSK